MKDERWKLEKSHMNMVVSPNVLTKEILPLLIRLLTIQSVYFSFCCSKSVLSDPVVLGGAFTNWNLLQSTPVFNAACIPINFPAKNAAIMNDPNVRHTIDS